MVIGFVKVEKTTKVKNNRYYGDYEIKDTLTHNIVNSQYVGLVPPENGIHIVLKTACERETLDITISKYAFTGEIEKEFDDYTEFSTAFSFSGHLYEVTVDKRGQLVCLDEWYSYGDFEDGNTPDGQWTKRSKGIKWELFEQ